jgi:hypothetical protein
MVRRNERLDRSVATIGDRDLDDFGVRENLANATCDCVGSLRRGESALERVRRDDDFQ